MLKLRARWDGKCPKHPRFDPRKDGPAGVKGGCETCLALWSCYQSAVAAVRDSGGTIEKRTGKR